jgi:hypothetical protein
MSVDIPSLIKKLRCASQEVGTFGRGDPNPLDEYRVVLSAAERDWLVLQCRTGHHFVEITNEMIKAGAQAMAAADTVDGPAYAVLAAHCLRAACSLPRWMQTEDES